MQKVGSDAIYYYAIYFYAEEGDLGLERGPSQTAIYKESSDATFNETTFNPNEDELLVEIEAGAGDENNAVKGKSDSGKNIDVSGGFESDLGLMNSDGNGLFNLSNIVYGDTLNFAVETYDGSAFEEVSTVTAGENNNDQTDKVKYKVKRRGVTGVVVPADERTAHEAVVEWDEIADATNYQVRLIAKSGRPISTTKATETTLTLTDLKAYHPYFVKVRAKIGNLYTVWSDAVKFKTAAE